MADLLTIIAVDLEDDYGLIVTFSDGTTARFTVEELVALRPYRERKTEKPS